MNTKQLCPDMKRKFVEKDWVFNECIIFVIDLPLSIVSICN